ncbi:MAG TPA: ATP-binding protein [Saprospiraceae bacterium]|nr:ATP-binding protein [Saprospiraceae bacterium]
MFITIPGYLLSRRTAWIIALSACVLGILILQLRPAHTPRDKAMVEDVQTYLRAQESSVSATLLDRSFFRSLIEVTNGQATVTNALIDKMRLLAEKSYALYLYKSDSLIYWSKPGPVIDPTLIRYGLIPIVASDHYEDFLIKEYDLYHVTSYHVYAKIPILNDAAHRHMTQVIPIKQEGEHIDTSRFEDWEILRTEEGVPVCVLQQVRTKLSFWHQIALLFFVVMGLLSMLILAMEFIHSRHQNFHAVAGGWLSITFIIGTRGVSLLTGYHEILDQLELFDPFVYLGDLGYSRGDLLIDSLLFLWIAVIAVKGKALPLRQQTTRIEKSVVIIGTYLIMILSMGLLAWIQKTLIVTNALPLELEEISFLNTSTAVVFASMGLCLFGLFVIGQRLLHSVAEIQPSIYRRIGDLLIAALISLSLLHMLDLNLSFFGFYLAVMSLLVLFDLYTEHSNPSVIWVVSWTLLIAGFEASMLYAYQKDKDRTDRLEMAQRIIADIDDTYGIEGQIFPWLPDMPPQNSIGVFKDRRLAYSYNYDYPLILQENTTPAANSKLIQINGRDDIAAHADDLTVVIGKRDTGLIKVVSTFSYVFTIFSIMLFFIALANSLLPFLPETLSLSFSSRPTLRNRIQVAIVFLIILAFVIIGFVTVFYLRNTTEDRDKRYFEDRLRAVASSILQAIPAIDSLDQTQSLIPRVAAIAYVYNRQAKLYNAQGDLVLQSEEKKSAPQRLSVKMSYLSKFLMDQSNRSYTVEDLTTSGQESYRGVLALRDQDNNRLGYVELPGTSMVQSTPDAGSKFFGTLLNAYVFLFLIAVALAIAVANSITRPLSELGEKLKKLSIGKKNEPIQWAINDEIGALINDYNGMIEKLDDSAQILALTERDLAWREMAKQVAHEIKNPLTPMKLSIQYLQNGVNTNPDKLKLLVARVSHTLIEQIDNLSNIASEFSNFAKMPQAENEKVLLNDVVASVHDLFRKREDMDIHLYVPIQDIYVFADRNQLLRVLNNVVKNAIQAIPDERRGRVDISLLKRDDRAVISITDNGNGIPDAMRDKVFSPNFTTKSSGTGLGLAICANIVETFNGKIYFATNPDEGTTFFIEIPLMRLEGNVKEQEHVML